MFDRLAMTCLAAAMLICGQPADAASEPAREVPVVYASDVPLAGLLIHPSPSRRTPAVVIVHGSGSSDRTNGWARAIAETIAQAGVAVLLTDKRGSGQSGGDWRTAGFDELADDALAGVRHLRTRNDIDPDRIGLVGLSQGGRIVPIAAARSDDVAFVVNIVGDAVSFGEQSAHEMRNIARQAGLDAELTREVLELNSAAGRALLTDEWTEYGQLREQALTRPWAPIAQGFPPVGAPIWTFLGKVADFDPMPYWILVRQPVLVVYGAEDEQDNVAVEESRRRLRFGFEQAGKTNYRIDVLPGVGHTLGWTPAGGLGPAAAAAISDWLSATVLDAEPRSDAELSAQAE
jgi:uncharacterized protein